MQKVLLFALLGLVILSLLPSVNAFGAGNIPSYAYLENSAFRHGDLDDVIVHLAKTYGGGLFGRDIKFTKLDVARIYFGNYMRDMSQAIDVASLKKTSAQNVINIVMVLSFLAFGYVTEEFEVNKDTLLCYRAEEHIDNPKGYADGEDARTYDPRLRGPVDPRELEIDPNTGMKNYIAAEGRGWDTSSALIRSVLMQCIEAGRKFRQTGDKADSYVSFQLLGRALHTLEDFTAHSNYCELALISMGHTQVFPQVGQNTKIRSPSGKDVFPLVTGTFGGQDFLHSMLGEGADKLSGASLSDVSKKSQGTRSGPDGQSDAIRTITSILDMLPSAESQSMTRDLDEVQNIRNSGQDPAQMSPQEMYQNIYKALSIRDKIMKRIANFIEKVPLLDKALDKLGDNLSVFALSTIEPLMRPLVSTALTALGESSAAVIASHDQQECWHDPSSSNPSHSYCAKDHFSVILNEPAGKIATKIVEFTVRQIVQAWNEPNMDPRQAIEPCLEALHHPDFAKPHSQIQQIMMQTMRQWFDSTGSNRGEILNRLTSDAVLNHKNIRIGAKDDGKSHAGSSFAQGGLQGALAGANIHVPGSQYLNMGQDLLGGKMPWQSGFGSGGAHAWRDLDPNAPPPGGYENVGGYQPGGDYNSGGGYQQGGQAQSYYEQGQGHQGGGYQQQQHTYTQQPDFNQSDYGNQGGYNQGFGGPPPPGQFGGPPPPPQGYQQGWGGPPPHHQQQPDYDGPPEDGSEKKKEKNKYLEHGKKAFKLAKEHKKAAGGGAGAGSFSGWRESGHGEDSDEGSNASGGSGIRGSQNSGSGSGSGSESGSASEQEEEEEESSGSEEEQEQEYEE